MLERSLKRLGVDAIEPSRPSSAADQVSGVNFCRLLKIHGRRALVIVDPPRSGMSDAGEALCSPLSLIMFNDTLRQSRCKTRSYPYPGIQLLNTRCKLVDLFPGSPHGGAIRWERQ